MTTPIWLPGNLYSPGSIVQPASALKPTPGPVVNGDFESGNVAWTLDAGFSIGAFGAGTFFTGSQSLQWNSTTTGRARASAAFAVTPGQSLTASCQVQQGASSSGQAGGRVEIGWYDATDTLISYSSGNLIDKGSNQKWKQSTVTAVAPSTAAFARCVGYAFRTSGSNKLWMDNFVWNLQISALPTGLVFKATQSVTGASASTEPVWPVTLGGTVVDNEVTWTGVYASKVVWQASPILTSGASEPVWPALADATIADNTIVWKAMNARVPGPQSKITTIASSKVFKGDGDIVPFSATTNCLDWTTPDDAGFIPFGLQAYGGTDVSALNIYRSNLVIFNSEGYQMWQIDEDPANISILDAAPMPCDYNGTLQPVMNDLVGLTSVGLRNVGIAGASTNLQAGTFGKQVDALIKPLLVAAIAAGFEPFAISYPNAGQYWVVFGVDAVVLTMNGTAKDYSWSRYVFPSAISDWTIHDTSLYLRSGDLVWRVSDLALTDDTNEGLGAGGTNTIFAGYMAWQYLDFGRIGDDKELESVEIAVNGAVSISVGWSQKKGEEALATTPYAVTGDTVTETPLPINLTAPSMQFRLTFPGGQAAPWEWMALGVSFV